MVLEYSTAVLKPPQKSTPATPPSINSVPTEYRLLGRHSACHRAGILFGTTHPLMASVFLASERPQVLQVAVGDGMRVEAEGAGVLREVAAQVRVVRKALHVVLLDELQVRDADPRGHGDLLQRQGAGRAAGAQGGARHVGDGEVGVTERGRLGRRGSRARRRTDQTERLFIIAGAAGGG